MKLKYLLGIGMACLMICSCSEEYMSFEGTDRIQGIKSVYCAGKGKAWTWYEGEFQSSEE